jgi:hypothetical protein
VTIVVGLGELFDVIERLRTVAQSLDRGKRFAVFLKNFVNNKGYYFTLEIEYKHED